MNTLVAVSTFSVVNQHLDMVPKQVLTIKEEIMYLLPENEILFSVSKDLLTLYISYSM